MQLNGVNCCTGLIRRAAKEKGRDLLELDGAWLK